ncbi:conserved hypothetical protein [Gloeothece citriformis PCC 7424]|uniref:Uncharacterized protein n=1 Tax=Gloeothece citriformis (strain PCC 7424) TaxID=65393 RepID=B7K904_GLOC7|nr:hypothetical protein [Gloeothece citriformis]ACK72773.1 conserved hypothetical protein [Gloeothece citriformis PCC 7424]
MATQTTITDLTVNSTTHCYQLTKDQMEGIQNKGATTALDKGIYVIRIKDGAFDYVKDANEVESEPLVMLWIYGGKFKNLKTHKQVSAGWSTLNGYDDTVTLAVSDPCKLCAFFFDTEIKDNAGDVIVSVVKVDEYREFN